jgi:hypothetical protein
MEGLKIVESEVLCIGRCKNGEKCKIWFNLGFLKSVERCKNDNFKFCVLNVQKFWYIFIS